MNATMSCENYIDNNPASDAVAAALPRARTPKTSIT